MALERVAALLLLIALLVPTASEIVEAQVRRDGTPGGVLIQAIVGDPPHLNVGITTSVAALICSAGIFESLLRFDEQFNPYPGLAERWEISPDGKEFTFYLVKNATWHDGTPFTAQDVKFTFERVLARYHPREREVLRTLDRVEVLDEYTVKFFFKEPNAVFLYTLNVHNAPILPKHLLEPYADNMTAAPFNSKPVGTGPFRFVEWKKGEYVRLERNPNYYLPGLPYLDGIVTRIFRDAVSAVLALEKGEVDYITGYYMPLSEAKRLQGSKDIVLTDRGTTITSPIFLMFYNIHKAPLNNLEFRKAVAYAINRQEILDKVFFGFGRIATGPIPSSSWAYTGDVEKYEFNPEKAKQILDSLGFRDIDNDGFREFPNGTKLVLTFPYNSGVAIHERTAQLVADMLRNVGIKVELKAYDEATLTTTVYSRREFDLAVERFSTGPDPVVGIGRLFLSTYAFSGVPFSNSAVSYNNSEVDKLLTEASRVVDRTIRKQLFEEFQRIVARDLPYLPLVEVSDVAAIRSNVRNLHAWSAESRVERVDVWIAKVAPAPTPTPTPTPASTPTPTTPKPTPTPTGPSTGVIVAIAAAVAIAAVAAYAITKSKRK
ncbi:MAG: ABC transporter substrate-binding protein [Fervidicoccaceae archaeon]